MIGPLAPRIEELSREFAVDCAADGAIRWLDPRAERLLDVRPGARLQHLCAPGTAGKADALLASGRLARVDGWELSLVLAGRPTTVVFAAAPDGADGLVLVGSPIPEHFMRALASVEQVTSELGQLHRRLVTEHRELERRHEELVRATGEPVVCVANDRAPARHVLARTLSRAGFRVIEATSGEQALELARRELPALMILDLELADLDSRELCRRLKADPATTTIAVLQTSETSVSLAAKVQGLEAGADASLTQPFTGAELVAAVRSLLRLQARELAERRRAEALAEADRRKDEFLAMLAHELRNPLAAIASAHALLATSPPRAAREARALTIARKQTEHLRRIVDDLLEVSRLMRGNVSLRRERLDVKEALLQATELVADSERRVSIAAPPGPVFVEGDATRLFQVFANLLANAVKYTQPGGHIEVSLVAEEPRAHVRVRDDGVGIAPEALAHVFDLFYQSDVSLHRAEGGLGIGLTLIRALVELHGGTVEAHSEGLGRGTAIDVFLPIAARAPAAANGRSYAESAPRGGARQRRVLIVEDNEDVRELLGDLCEEWGHEVMLACDGPQGVALALDRRPDVALVDIGLPGLDGCEVARRIRADPRGAGVHLVALSGYGSREIREATAEAGFELHLVKPADPERLAEFIASAAK